MKNTKLNRLSDRYLAALRLHFKEGAAVNAKSARRLGTQSVALGLETLGLAKIHDRALATLTLPDWSISKRSDMAGRAAIFFNEVISPIEKTHGQAKKAGAEMDKLRDVLTQQTSDLAGSRRELRRGIALRLAATEALATDRRNSAAMLEKSRRLQKHLQDKAHQILTAQESDRRAMSLKLQDEIAQTLLGIHIRLLALTKEISNRNEDFQKEIAITQRLVRSSMRTIKGFARQFGIKHEG